MLKEPVQYFKRQNLGIKVGLVALVITLLLLVIGVVLLATAQFNPGSTGDANGLGGNGFHALSNFSIPSFLSASGYTDIVSTMQGNGFIRYDVAQVSAGIVFLIILPPIFGGVGIISLLGGLFKRWLYT